MVRFLSLCLLLAVGGAHSALTSAHAQTLVIAGTGGASQAAQREAWYVPFMEDTGIQIVEDEYDQKLAQIRAQVESGTLKWDIATVPQLVLKVGCAEGLFERVEWSSVLDPTRYEFKEPITPCGLPVVNSSGVLVYDADRLEDGPKTWADFWDVERWPGKRGLWYGPQETLEVALLADGVAPDEVMKALAAPDGVERAFRKLDQLKPHIHWWKSGSESLQLLGTGEVVMTYAWNGRVATANLRDKRNFRMVWQAGHPNGSSTLAILRGSRNRNQAVEFIAYAASPEAQARFARTIPYGPPNQHALDLLEPTLRAQLPTAHWETAQSQATDLYARFWLEHADSLNERFAAWASR